MRSPVVVMAAVMVGTDADCFQLRRFLFSVFCFSTPFLWEYGRRRLSYTYIVDVV